MEVFEWLRFMIETAVMVFSGLNFTTLKMALIVVFLWCASPVSSHLIARLEVSTNDRLKKYCETEAGLSEEGKIVRLQGKDKEDGR